MVPVSSAAKPKYYSALAAAFVRLRHRLRYPIPHYPLEYCIHCKRNKDAGLPFLTDNIGDDLLIVIVAFALVLQTPIWGAMAILLLHLSLWMVYEIGYFENDSISATLERESKTPPRFIEFRDKFSVTTAWVYAAVFGAAGIWAVSQVPDWYFADAPENGVWIAAIIWVGVLIALRTIYWFYNRVDKMSRILLYLPLQILKYAFPILFVGLAPAGAALIFAQILRRWLPYIVYRYSGVLHKDLPIRALRLLVFLTVWVLLVPSNITDPAHFIIGGAAAVLLSVRGMSQLRAIIRNVKSVRDDDWQPRKS